MERTRKITAFQFLNSLMFSVNNQANTSLPDIAADVHKEFEIDISKEALHKKFTPEAVDFFKRLLTEQMNQKLDCSIESHLKKHFKGIKVKDSTKFALPSTYQDEYPSFNNFSKKNGVMNLQHEFDLINGRWDTLKLTNIKVNDQQDSKDTVDQLEEGNLYIRDLGYVSPSYLKGCQESGAFFINRMPPTAAIFDAQDNRISWTEIDRGFKKKGLNNLDRVLFIYRGHKIKCRMVIIPVSNEEARVRLKKARESAKKRGVGITKEHKIRCHYKAFITNVDQDLLTADQIKHAYRLRWQVELVFKTWKSFFSINKVKKVKKERLECQLLARLLWIILNWDLFRITNQYVKRKSPDKGVSILKFFNRSNRFIYTLRMVLLNKMQVNQWLKKEFLPLMENTQCEAKGSKPTSYQILNSILCSLS